MRRVSHPNSYGKILSLSVCSISKLLAFPALWRAACISIAGTLCPFAQAGVSDRSGSTISEKRKVERRLETIRRGNPYRERARVHGAIGSFLPEHQSSSRPSANHRIARGKRTSAGSNRGRVWRNGACHFSFEFAPRVRRPGTHRTRSERLHGGCDCHCRAISRRT